MDSQEKVAYLKGLMEGLKLDPAKDETRLFNAVVDILSDLVKDVNDLSGDLEDLEDDFDDLSDYVDELVEDDDEDDEDEDDEDDEDDDDVDLGDFDDDFFEINCPKCGNSLYVDGGILEEGSLECPDCGSVIEFRPCDHDCASCDAEDEDEDKD